MHVQDVVTPAGYAPLQEIVARSEGGLTSTGHEPGNTSYSTEGNTILIRTRCLTAGQLNALQAEEGQTAVGDFAYVEQRLRAGDILIAKDGPVGAVGIVGQRATADKRFMCSSGIVRVRVPGDELFYFGILKGGPYTTDVELLTPTSSTFAHAGVDLVLSARVPLADKSSVEYQKVRWLTRLMLTAERVATSRYIAAVKVLDELLDTENIDLNDAPVGFSSFSTLSTSGRFDAAYHSAIASSVGAALQLNEASSLDDLVNTGAVTRTRGQNLQVAQIGFSEKHDDDRPGSYRLLEPNFIRKDMGVEKYRRLSCSRSLQTLRDGAVVMSAEGSIGRVTLYRDEPGVGTVSNIHALQMDSTRDGVERAQENAWLAASLVYLREKGWLDAISVGGQGGSLAIKYHDDVPVPQAPEQAKRQVYELLSGGTYTADREVLLVADVNDLIAIAHAARSLSHAELGVLRREAEAALRQGLPIWFPSLY